MPELKGSNHVMVAQMFDPGLFSLTTKGESMNSLSSTFEAPILALLQLSRQVIDHMADHGSVSSSMQWSETRKGFQRYFLYVSTSTSFNLDIRTLSGKSTKLAMKRVHHASYHGSSCHPSCKTWQIMFS